MDELDQLFSWAPANYLLFLPCCTNPSSCQKLNPVMLLCRRTCQTPGLTGYSLSVTRPQVFTTCNCGIIRIRNQWEPFTQTSNLFNSKLRANMANSNNNNTCVRKKGKIQNKFKSNHIISCPVSTQCKTLRASRTLRPNTPPAGQSPGRSKAACR